MRKITILEENYMALEQKIAEALDAAESKIELVEAEVLEMITQLDAEVQSEENFHMTPEFINFKNSLNIESIIQEIDGGINEMVKSLKSSNRIGLELSAYLSKSFDAIMDIEPEYENEVEESVSFFGMENTNIPDSVENKFEVTISDAGIESAIKNIISLREMFEQKVAEIQTAIETGKTPELFVSGLKKIMMLKDMTAQFLGE